MQLKYSPEINFGHILQTVVVLGSVGGWALFGYYSIETQLTGFGHKTDLIEQRITQNEAAAIIDRAEHKAFASDIRNTLDKIVDKISDLRASVGPPRNAPH